MYPLLKAISYVDDNCRYTTAKDAETLFRRVQQYINLASAFYNVNRIARKCPKSVIRLYGLNPEEQKAAAKRNFTSIAWNYALERPAKDAINIIIQTSHWHPEELDPEEGEYQWDHEDPTYGQINKDQEKVRHFGTLLDMEGRTESRYKVLTMKTNITTIYRNKTNVQVAVLAHNTLVPGIGEFNPLHNSYTAYEASEIVDGETGTHYKTFGLTVNDPRHVISLPRHLMGHGVRHAGGAALCGKARELEIHANANSHLGGMIRARLNALRAENSNSPNFLRRAIIELATYGYYFRDTTQSFHSEMMDTLLRRDPSYAPPLGTPGHSTDETLPDARRRDICIGPGHREIAEIYSFGSPLCTLLSKYTDPTQTFEGDPFTKAFWADVTTLSLIHI